MILMRSFIYIYMYMYMCVYVYVCVCVCVCLCVCVCPCLVNPPILETESSILGQHFCSINPWRVCSRMAFACWRFHPNEVPKSDGTKLADHSKLSYWCCCLVGNEGMIRWLTINNNPSNPHSHPFPSIPY